MMHFPPIPPMPQRHSQAVGGGLAPAIPNPTADAAAAAAVVAPARELLRGHALLVHAVAPVAARAGAGGQSVGVTLLLIGFAVDAR